MHIIIDIELQYPVWFSTFYEVIEYKSHENL